MSASAFGAFLVGLPGTVDNSAADWVKATFEAATSLAKHRAGDPVIELNRIYNQFTTAQTAVGRLFAYYEQSEQDLRAKLQERDNQMKDLTAKLRTEEAQAREFKAKLEGRDNEVKDITAKLRTEEAQARDLKTALKARTTYIKELKASLAWRITKPLRALRRSLTLARRYWKPRSVYRVLQTKQKKKQKNSMKPGNSGGRNALAVKSVENRGPNQGCRQSGSAVYDLKKLSRALLTRASALEEAGDLLAATEAYREALEKVPNHRDALRSLARVQYAQNDYEGATKTYRQISEHSWATVYDLKKLSRALLTRASALEEAGNLLAATEAYREVLEKVPNHRNALRSLARVQYAQNDYEGATKTYRQISKQSWATVYDLKKLSRALLTRASALEEGGDLLAATEAYREVLEKVPNHRNALRSLARVQYAQNDYEGATKTYRQISQQSWAQGRRRSETSQLVQATFAGFGTASADKLEAIVADRERPIGEVAWASIGLSRWYNFTNEYERALKFLRIGKFCRLKQSASPSIKHDLRQLILETELLFRLDRVEEAKAIIDEAIGRFGEIPELQYLAANAITLNPDLPQSEKDQLRLEWLNKPLISAGLMPLQIRDRGRSLLLDNIGAQIIGGGPDSGPVKVSVLMAAYNSESTIATAIFSILSQTWENLELVVVDDASSDQTWRRIQSFAARDSRVTVIRHKTNRGAYAARNTALAAAIGEFVTVQDSDDWSHPQRLALQVKPLVQSDALLNITDWIRVDPSLRVQTSRIGTVVGINYSSLMIRRQAALKLGGWDECRMGADDEFYQRALLKYGLKSAEKRIQPDTPLCLARFRDGSLTTASQGTGLDTIHYGARREYLEAFHYWHQLEIKKNLPDALKLPAERPFPIPNICRPRPSRSVKFDIVLVSDLSRGEETISMLRSANDSDLCCGCFHWPSLINAGTKVNPDIRRLLHDGIAASVVGGETVAARLVIVSDPVSLLNMPDRIPVFRTQTCVVLMNDRQTPHEIKMAINNAYVAFGVSPVLAPTSAAARQLLLTVGVRQELTAQDWEFISYSPDPESTSASSMGTRAASSGSRSMTKFTDVMAPYLAPKDLLPGASAAHSRPSKMIDVQREIDTLLVVLDYCGGKKTDDLYSKLKSWNPNETIFVLDNASPSNSAACATHHNTVNSYVGGGLIDCIELAKAQKARYLFFCVNDIEFLDRLDIAEFQHVMDSDPDVVQFSCSITSDSDQARNFPWMVSRRRDAIRRVRQADLLCCAIRLDFLETFGGFPESKSGWGYAAELAYQAKLQRKKILVNDRCRIQHFHPLAKAVITESGDAVDKLTEVKKIYGNRYGDWLVPRSALDEPTFNEEIGIASFKASGK